MPEPIIAGEGGALLFSITPPKLSTTPEQAQDIADAVLRRLDGLDVDALVLYDIDDESDRNAEERPFPYLPTMDPARFLADHLGGWRRPAVVYRCVGKYDEEELAGWLAEQPADRVLGVFVGASSGTKEVRTSLAAAQKLRAEARPDLRLGGVAIPERGVEESQRMLRKQEAGCSFFITQVVYDASAAKSMVSDYLLACRERGATPVPVVFTLSVCGSVKTLAFLEWLGVDVPRWMRNDLAHAPDPLAVSFDQCLATARELAAFCERLGAPYGFNVESVSIRRTEIEASVRLAKALRH
ncbi:5,10-methylenetetrahydrofolate reductase [Nocardioides sp. BP30]|uniref:methylenetetrahydrofolate reductase n=1 Tax=Nocardioides sp. BP30 TaxID=3036374 RepID=UPI002468C0B1|nr:5,10-methylenetetrahydrofolate reductase [Nocardioides sp. BP30]WGL51476.1 5,10-methylenetetrahydrofolate reductase [Nocardioides sp. BP30]